MTNRETEELIETIRKRRGSPPTIEQIADADDVSTLFVHAVVLRDALDRLHAANDPAAAVRWPESSPAQHPPHQRGEAKDVAKWSDVELRKYVKRATDADPDLESVLNEVFRRGAESLLDRAWRSMATILYKLMDDHLTARDVQSLAVDAAEHPERSPIERDDVEEGPRYRDYDGVRRAAFDWARRIVIDQTWSPPHDEKPRVVAPLLDVALPSARSST